MFEPLLKDILTPLKVEHSYRSVIKVSGADAADYLDRQLTSKIDDLKIGNFHMSARLDRAGRVFSFFYILRDVECFYLALPEELVEKTCEELDKYLFAEDCQIEVVEKELSLIKGENLAYRGFSGQWAGLNCLFTFENVELPVMNESSYNSLIKLTAWPELDVTQKLDILINNSRLNELAVSYNKGCFLGQETVSKIQSRRGASHYPALVETKPCDVSVKFFEKEYILESLARNSRVEGMSIDLGIVKNIPLKELEEKEVFVKKVYHKAISLFHKDHIDSALELLDLIIDFHPAYADAYETKGAILGQSGKFDDAIEMMDKLLKVDENSVMAHTNKSLYLMKQGKIEEAEEEKALATVASFKKLGSEAKEKKQINAELEKQKVELERKKEMFLQVLELDVQDELANYGMADYYYRNDEFEKSYEHVKTVLSNNDKYSVAYSLLGKVCEKLGKIEEAKNVYHKGIEIASQNGDMMPANEMQANLNNLTI